MNKELKLYEINADESDIYAVSCVDMPAVDSNFIFLNKQNEQPIYVNLEKDEKRMVYGCALRTDFPIYRRMEDNEFYIQFSKKCVEELSKKFMKNGFQSNWTTDHQDSVKGLTVVESWIKVDMEKDKSIALGLDKDLALGSWFIGCSVDNDEVWETIKSGKWNGFSIEAMVVLDEIKLQKQDTNMTDVKLETVEITESFWSKLKSIIAEALGKEESAPEVEEAVEEVKSEVIEEPIEVVEEMAEETPIEEPVVEEEIAAEEIVAEVIDIVEDPQTTEEEKENELQAVVDDLTEKLKQKDAEIAEMQKQIEKLSKQPSTEPIKVDASKQNAHPSFLDFATGRISYK